MHIPIVAASGADNSYDVRAVYALNGNCFLRKPSDLTRCLRVVDMCCEFCGGVVTLSPAPESISANPSQLCKLL